MTTEAKMPKFNHVAMTMPADALDETGRKAILNFYGEVFGWQELPTETKDRQQLVMMAYEFGQFVFLVADESPLSGTFADHFGMAVDTVEELHAMHARAKAYAERDDRVRVEELMVDDFGMLDLTAFYVNYLLPLTVEVQHFNWKQQ
jgi:hypothetical protein